MFESFFGNGASWTQKSRAILKFVTILALFVVRSLPAQSVTISWAISPSTNVVGYLVSYGTDGVTFPNEVDAGTNLYWTFTNLPAGSTNYFDIAAYDASQNFSPATPVVTCVVPGSWTNVNTGTNTSGDGGSNTNSTNGGGTNTVAGGGTTSGGSTNTVSNGGSTNTVSGGSTNTVSNGGSTNTPVVCTNCVAVTAYTASTNGPYGSLGWNGGLNIGQTFVLSGTNLEILSLGIYNYGGNGLNAPHTVTLFLNVNGQYIPVRGGSVTVPAGPGPLLTNGYRYQSLPSPIVLTPGSYALVAFQMNGGPSNDPYSEYTGTAFDGVPGFVNTGSTYQFTTDAGPGYPASTGSAPGSAGVTYGCTSFLYIPGGTTNEVIASNTNTVTGGGDTDTNSVGGTGTNTVSGNGTNTVTSTNTVTGTDTNTVTGGSTNTVSNGGSTNTVSGGSTNTVSNGGSTNTVSGGSTNTVSNGGSTNTVSGSSTNTVSNGGSTNTVSGGSTNTVSNGGSTNTADGGSTNYSLTTAYTASTNGPYGTLGYNGGLNIGQTFSVSGTNLQIFSLGVYNYGGAGLHASHTVTLFLNNGLAYVPVTGGSVTVPAGTAAPLTNGYRYQSLPAPVVLTPGNYAIIAFQMNGGPNSDAYCEYDTTAFQGFPGFVNTGSVYQFTSDPGPNYPAQTGASASSAGVTYGCASFMYGFADTNSVNNSDTNSTDTSGGSTNTVTTGGTGSDTNTVTTGGTGSDTNTVTSGGTGSDTNTVTGNDPGTNSVGGTGTNTVTSNPTNTVTGGGTNTVSGTGTNTVSGGSTNTVAGNGTNSVSGGNTNANTLCTNCNLTVAYTGNIGGPYGTLGWNGGLNIGQTFVLTSTNLEVSALGVYNYAGTGLKSAHTVAILMNVGGSYTPVPGGTITVPAGTNTLLTNSYRFASLPAPVVLTPGSYAVIVFQMNGGPNNDPYSDDTGANNQFNSIPGLYNTGSVYQFTTAAGPNFPSGGGAASAGVTYGSASFIYTTTANTSTNSSGSNGQGNVPHVVGASQVEGSQLANPPGATVLTNAGNGFNILVSGNGSIAPVRTASSYVDGTRYSLTAVAKAGSVFDSWTSNGVEVSINPHFTFTVVPGLTLQANFLTNPFTAVAGTYHGLFYVPGNAVGESSGSIAATVTKSGAYTAKIYVAAHGYSISGAFNAEGAASKTINRPGASAVTIQLQLGLTNGSMTGTVASGDWMAELVANLGVYSSTNPAPQAGKYTLVIPGNGGASSQPAGNGFGSVIVNSMGTVTFSGTLGDGTPVSSTSAVTAEGQWPFYTSAYNSGGSVLGWFSFSSGGYIGGQVGWFKSQQLAAKLYPAGFSINSDVIGSSYQYTNGTPLLGAESGQLFLADGNLASSVSNNVAFGKSSAASAFTLNPASGQFKARVINPATSKPIQVSGVVLQNQKMGAGYFLGQTASGSALLLPQE